MGRLHSVFTNIVFTLLILVIFFCLSIGIQKVAGECFMIPALFTLAVFLISLVTEGYFYGIAASLLSVLAINYAFTFPYLKFNFSIHANFISALIMLIITIISSMLTIKAKQIEKMKSERDKEKMKANLFRAVSHDLRSPLTTIYGSCVTISDRFDYLTREQIIKLAEGIKDDSQWLIGVVENLLSITKIDHNGVKLVKSQVVLEELIDTSIVRFKKRYPGQEILVEIPEEFITIPMDAVLIEQVIINLLENAVLYAVGLTHLIIKVYIKNKKAVFEIIDDGKEMVKDRFGSILAEYVENEDTPVDHKKGSMGIGMSLCISVIKAHNGDINVERIETGGCIVRFSLTLEEKENEQ